MPVREHTIPAECVDRDCDDCPQQRARRSSPFAPRTCLAPVLVVRPDDRLQPVTEIEAKRFGANGFRSGDLEV